MVHLLTVGLPGKKDFDSLFLILFARAGISFKVKLRDTTLISFICSIVSL